MKQFKTSWYSGILLIFILFTITSGFVAEQRSRRVRSFQTLTDRLYEKSDREVSQNRLSSSSPSLNRETLERSRHDNNNILERSLQNDARLVKNHRRSPRIEDDPEFRVRDNRETFRVDRAARFDGRQLLERSQNNRVERFSRNRNSQQRLSSETRREENRDNRRVLLERTGDSQDLKRSSRIEVNPEARRFREERSRQSEVRSARNQGRSSRIEDNREVRDNRGTSRARFDSRVEQRQRVERSSRNRNNQERLASEDRQKDRRSLEREETQDNRQRFDRFEVRETRVERLSRSRDSLERENVERSRENRQILERASRVRDNRRLIAERLATRREDRLARNTERSSRLEDGRRILERSRNDRSRRVVEENSESRLKNQVMQRVERSKTRDLRNTDNNLLENDLSLHRSISQKRHLIDVDLEQSFRDSTRGLKITSNSRASTRVADNMERNESLNRRGLSLKLENARETDATKRITTENHRSSTTSEINIRKMPEYLNNFETNRYFNKLVFPSTAATESSSSYWLLNSAKVLLVSLLIAQIVNSSQKSNKLRFDLFGWASKEKIY